MMNRRYASSRILISSVLILILTLILTLSLSLLFTIPALAVTANAGVDTIVNEGELAILDGSNSTGSSLSFVWSEGNSILSTDESFHKVLTTGIHIITLNVTDNVNGTATDSVTITVNDLPQADAGTDKTVAKDENVVCDASGSIDNIGGIVSYEWSEEGTVLSTSKKLRTQFTAGVHTITLKVTDKYGKSDTDDIKVTVAVPPIANAGADRRVYEGTKVLLNGTNSTDPDGHIVSYKWAEGSEIYNTAQSFEKVFPIGVHTITLNVTDNDGATGTDTVDIEILKLDKAPPIADAGADIFVGVGESVVLNASGSSDRDGNIVSYLWSEDGGVLSNASSFENIFDAGKHTITLTVTDNDNLQGDDTIIVTVLAPNIIPIAKAGTDYNVPQGYHVIFDASQSSDSDGTIELYEWSENGKLLSSNESFRTPMDVGVHHITLTITDNDGGVSTDSVIVTVYVPISQSQSDSNKSGIPFIFLFVVSVLLFLVIADVIIILKRRSKGTSNNMNTRRPKRPEIDSIGMQTEFKPIQGTVNGHAKSKDYTNTVSPTCCEDDTENKPASTLEESEERKPTPIVKVVKQPEDMIINITDSTTGMPVANAKISIGSSIHTTDKKGNALFKEISGNTLTITVSARLYQDCTQNMTASSMMRLELVPLPLITPKQEHSMSNIKKGIDESYRSIMTYDTCIPSFYRSIVYNHIDIIHGITAGQLSQSKIEPKDLIDALIAKTELVSQRISHAMTLKRIIDIYSVSSTSMECTASKIDINKLNHLIIDSKEYYAYSYHTVQRRLSDVDSQITLISRQMSVIPLSNLLKITKELLECDAKSQLERAICVFVADNILDHIVEMYNNEHIINRLKLGVL